MTPPRLRSSCYLAAATIVVVFIRVGGAVVAQLAESAKHAAQALVPTGGVIVNNVL